jgi:solute carrier family 25 (adenine nucleotide translocator) protein 4/5/6/31
LYRGFGIAIIGIIPYRAVYFGGYDTLKSIFLSDPEKAKNFWYKWAVSQTNTVLAQTLVYPYVNLRS